MSTVLTTLVLSFIVVLVVIAGMSVGVINGCKAIKRQVSRAAMF